MAKITAIICLDTLAEYPVNVKATFSWEQEPEGFTWQPIRLDEVWLSAGANHFVEITESVKKDVLAAARLLNAAANEQEQMYNAIKKQIRQGNPQATFADALLSGMSFRHNPKTV